MAQGALRLSWLFAGFALPGPLWAGCQLGECKAEPTKPKPGFHACCVKHRPLELSALFWAAKDTFQLCWDTRLQPASTERQSWDCTGMLPLSSPPSRFRIKKLNPPLPFLAAAQPSFCAPPVACAGQGRTARRASVTLTRLLTTEGIAPSITPHVLILH